jgi:putative ABC transport system permease protein
VRTAGHVRVYGALLGCLPTELRRDFGRDMQQLFADRLRETRGNPASVVSLWLSALADLASAASREWGARAVRAARSSWREGMTMDGWMQDIRFGVRSLLRRPGFTVAAVSTLALGIGATVSIFSVVNSVLLQPLPFPDADRLVVLETVDVETGTRGNSVDHPDVRTWQAAIPEVRVAGYSGVNPTLTGLGDPAALQATRVTDGLLELMGFAPLLGRDLAASDDVPDGPRVAVVSHQFWSERLGRDPGAVGRLITLSGEPWEIVGVAPEEFDFPRGTEVWLARRHQAEGCDHGCRIMAAVARLAPDTGFEEAQERFATVDQRLQEEFPDSHRDTRTELERMIDHEVGSVRAALWVLFGAVAMVLLIACANVANLLLVRAQQRRGEVALRATLGAGRGRLVRQLLTESTLLAIPAGLIGAGLAAWGTTALVAIAPEGLPRLDETSLDATALAFTVVLVLLVSALFGALPAIHLSRDSLSGSLGSGSRTAGDRGAAGSRSLLLVGEVALSLSLLLGAGLLFRTMVEIRAVDLGFVTENVERFRVSIPESRYDSLAVGRFFDELEGELAAIPGVESVGSGFGVPFASGRMGTSIELLDRPELPPADRPGAAIRPSTPGYLAASGMTLLRGRWFDEDDRHGNPGVAVINRTMARLHYADADPLGKQLRASISWGFEDDPARTIVGVVEDVRVGSATAAPAPAIYIPNAQFGVNSMYVSLRLAPGRASVIPEAREVLRAIDPGLAITNTERVADAVAREHAAPRFYLTLLTVFSILAVILTAVGLYGVVAYAVSRRTSEIGIRIALGADSADVVGMVLRQGIRPAALGMALGLLLSLLGARVLESLLFGVVPHDPLTLAGATVTLAVVVVAATLVPARRASRIQPASALRTD